MAPKRKLRSSAEEGAGEGGGAAAVAGGAAGVKAEGAQQRAGKKSKAKKVRRAYIYSSTSTAVYDRYQHIYVYTCTPLSYCCNGLQQQ